MISCGARRRGVRLSVCLRQPCRTVPCPTEVLTRRSTVGPPATTACPAVAREDERGGVPPFALDSIFDVPFDPSESRVRRTPST
jgi:hypothetical protein